MRYFLFLMTALCVASTAVAQPPTAATPPPPVADASLRAALAMPREQPIDFVVVLEALVAFERTDLAQPIVDELVQQNFDDQAKAVLTQSIGTARLLRLARNQEMPAALRDFATSAVAAAAGQATSLDRIADLTRQLSDPATTKQQAAVRELALVGEPAIAPVIGLLARADAPAAARGPARQTLLRLAPASLPAMLAVLDSEKPTLRADMAELLAGLRATQVAGPLAAVALQSTGDESADARIAAAFAALAGEPASIKLATQLLEREIANAAGGVPLFVPTDGLVATYLWDDTTAKLAKRDLPVDDANAVHAARLAQLVAKLHGQHADLGQRAVRLAIEAAAIVGDDPPASVEWSEFSTSELVAMLDAALAAEQSAAAVAILNQIAKRGDAAALATNNTQPGPLARSLRSGSLRVQAAAVAAFGAIDPAEPFAGSSYMADALVHALTAHGRRVVVAGAPRLEVAATWAGGLSTMGLEPEVATTGRQLIEVATASVDVEQIWIDMTINEPGVREVVFQLRRHPFTVQVPIVLVAREGQLGRAQQIADEHRRVIAKLRPHNDEARLAMGESLGQLLPRNWPTAEERVENAVAANSVVQKLLQGERDFYRLRSAIAKRASDIDPLAVGEKSWQSLSLLGTPGSQQMLIELASRGALAAEQRNAALAAFQASVDRFGVLLSTDTIESQYALYNQSLAAGRDDTELLSKILDAIESPRRRQLEAEATAKP